MLGEEIRKIKSTVKDLRNFGLVVGGGFLLLGGILFWSGSWAYPYILPLGAALVLLGLIAPGILRPLQKVWMTFAVVMGWFMTRVILVILFYLVFTPMGVAARFIGKRFLDLGAGPSRESYWIYREEVGEEREECERQF